jgi:hypothetical protein
MAEVSAPAKLRRVSWGLSLIGEVKTIEEQLLLQLRVV